MHGYLQKIIFWTILGMLLLLAALLLFAVAFLWIADYESFSRTILLWVGKQDWAEYFKQKVFPLSRFLWSRYLIATVLLLYIGFFLWIYPKLRLAARELANATTYFSALLYSNLRNCGRLEASILLLLMSSFVLRNAYHIYSYEVEYDEAWTYNHFISKGFFISAISPNNNHILYTLLASMSDYLPFPPKYTLRMPAFFAGFAAVLLCFAIVKQLFGRHAAIVSLAVFAFSSSITFFSVLGRGYGLMLLFTVLSYAAMHGWLTNASGKGTSYRGLFVLAHILGMYSNSGFLYVWLANIGAYLLLCERKATLYRGFLAVNLLIAFVLAFLHLPLLLSNGFSVLTDAAQSAQSESAAAGYWFYLNRVADWLLWGRGAALFWVFPLYLGFLAIFCWRCWHLENLRIAFVTIFIQVTLPFLLFFCTGIETPYRLWCYELFFLSLSVGLFWGLLQERYVLRGTMTAAFALLFALGTGYISETHYFMNWSATPDREAKKMAKLLLSQSPIPKECYTFSRYDKPLLEYYFLTQNRTLKCWMPFEESKDFSPFGQRRYDAVLLDIDDYKPSKRELYLLDSFDYELIYQNHRVQLYLPK